ncbi:MAG: hypothetical protein Q9163_005569 [Psora crenata]
MSFIFGVLPYTLLFALFAPCLTTSPLQRCDPHNEAQVDIDTFQKLLSQVDPPALHAALHDFSPRKFKHGMFQEDRTAVEAIHREQPGIATGILKMANLVKRQDNGTAASTTSTQETPQPATTLVTPVPQGDESTTAVVESPTITTATSNRADTTVTNSAPVTSQASLAPSATDSSSATSLSLTAGEVVTTTNSVGLTIISTVGGGATTLSPSETPSDSPPSTARRSSMTSTLVRTSTLPNGQQSTITAITVVAGGNPPDTPTGTAGVVATGTQSVQPGLQTGEAMMTRGFGKEMAVVLGAAVGAAILM